MFEMFHSRTASETIRSPSRRVQHLNEWIRFDHRLLVASALPVLPVSFKYLIITATPLSVFFFITRVFASPPPLPLSPAFGAVRFAGVEASLGDLGALHALAHSHATDAAASQWPSPTDELSASPLPLTPAQWSELLRRHDMRLIVGIYSSWCETAIAHPPLAISVQRYLISPPCFQIQIARLQYVGGRFVLELT
jgi:hypothetical protein